MNHKTWVEIDERALTQNITALRGLLNPGARFCLCVKSNAYGHGLMEVARIAGRAGVDAFAVDNVDEALMLRAEFPSALLIVLGYTMKDRYEDALMADLHLTMYDRECVFQMETVAAQRARTAFIHLKIETGTARQGVLPADVYDILDDIGRCGHVALAGVSTHFANIEDTTDPRFATEQFTLFQECVNSIRTAGFQPEWIHCACSAAVILYPDTHGTLVRAGLSSYGLWPSPSVEQSVRRHNIPLELQPVLTWKTRIAQVKSLPVGTPVGYGLTETLKRNSRIAVLPVGYWDGYDRGLSSSGEVLISGIRCKVIGRVCMNMCMVDVSAVPQAEPEAEVVLLGQSGRFAVTAEELAEKVGSINYEIVTRINPLIPRIVV
ncbi:alanine racemase [bacterium]|nr:alanine racemase [bacterium]